MSGSMVLRYRAENTKPSMKVLATPNEVRKKGPFGISEANGKRKGSKTKGDNTKKFHPLFLL